MDGEQDAAAKVAVGEGAVGDVVHLHRPAPVCHLVISAGALAQIGQHRIVENGRREQPHVRQHVEDKEPDEAPVRREEIGARQQHRRARASPRQVFRKLHLDFGAVGDNPHTGADQRDNDGRQERRPSPHRVARKREAGQRNLVAIGVLEECDEVDRQDSDDYTGLEGRLGPIIVTPATNCLPVTVRKVANIAVEAENLSNPVVATHGYHTSGARATR